MFSGPVANNLEALLTGFELLPRLCEIREVMEPFLDKPEGDGHTIRPGPWITGGGVQTI